MDDSPKDPKIARLPEFYCAYLGVETMNQLARLVAVFLLCGTSAAFSQEWSAEQMEVWAAVEKLTKDFYAGDIDSLDTHPEFIFWNSKNSAPGNKQTSVLLDKAWFGQGVKYYGASSTPLTIKVHGDFATVNSYLRVYEVLPGEESPTFITGRFHSDWKKENGTWHQIANFFYPEE